MTLPLILSDCDIQWAAWFGDLVMLAGALATAAAAIFAYRAFRAQQIQVDMLREDRLRERRLRGPRFKAHRIPAADPTYRANAEHDSEEAVWIPAALFVGESEYGGDLKEIAEVAEAQDLPPFQRDLRHLYLRQVKKGITVNRWRIGNVRPSILEKKVALRMIRSVTNDVLKPNGRADFETGEWWALQYPLNASTEGKLLTFTLYFESSEGYYDEQVFETTMGEVGLRRIDPPSI